MAVIEEIIEENTVPIKTTVQNENKKVTKVEEEPINKEGKTETNSKELVDQDGDVFFDSFEYQPEELERLIKESNEYKVKGNEFFAKAEYKEAIQQYENALMVCPESLSKDRAIYFGNIAACHFKQNEFKEAKDMSTQSLKLNPTYYKSMLRRAQANEKINSSASLTQALEDYTTLQKSSKDTYILRECQRAHKELPNKIQQKTEQEKEEMIAKLKDLGNSFLGKFGLSTDNFQFQPDPSGSGGYSMNFVNK